MHHGEDIWTVAGVIATGVGALFTAVMAFFIYRQTSATREAAQAGAKTAKAAVDALEVTREEQARGQFLAIEAVKTRIDASMPVLTVMPPELLWPPFVPSSFGEAQPHKLGEPFRLPRDNDERLLVRVKVVIVNDGPKIVSLGLNQEFVTNLGPVKSIVVPIGKSVVGTFEVAHSIKEWSDIWTEREATHAGGPSEHFQMMYTEPSDTGAVEYHDVIVQGTVLRPVANEDGAWVVLDKPDEPWGDFGNIVASVQPTSRHYWLSRSKQVPLPEIPLNLS